MKRSATRLPISEGDVPAGHFSKFLIFVAADIAGTTAAIASSAHKVIQILFNGNPLVRIFLRGAGTASSSRTRVFGQTHRTPRRACETMNLAGGWGRGQAGMPVLLRLIEINGRQETDYDRYPVVEAESDEPGAQIAERAVQRVPAG